MEVPTVVVRLLLPLVMQWLLVTANPTGDPPITTMDLGADATSTTPDSTPQTGDRAVFIPVTYSVAVNMDAPATNPHVHSAEGGISNKAPSTLTDIPATIGNERGAVGVNPTTVTIDRDGVTVVPITATSHPHLVTSYWDTHNTNPSTATTGPVIVATEATTMPETRAPRPAKVKVEPICPTGCECEHLEVHCSRAGLVAFPKGLDPGTTYLDVGHNRLTAIADDELAQLGLTKLTSLICDDNAIESVGRYAFRGLRDLALLQLSGNRIRHLSPFVFVGNTDLRHIDLTGNPLELERGPVLMVQQLEWLDLDQCNITQLSLDAFRDMRGLRYLNLSGNRISSLTLSHFSGLNYLRYIKLNGNPLLCDCSMKPVWRWFRQQTVHVDAKCVAPANGSIQSWNFLELLNCDAPSRP